MTGRFDDKVVVVTGGTSGIGLATAKAFAAEGAAVFVTGRRQDVLDAAVKAIGGRVTGVRGDMTVLADIDRLYDAVQQRHAQIDVVFANAAGGGFAPLGTAHRAEAGHPSLARHRRGHAWGSFDDLPPRGPRTALLRHHRPAHRSKPGRIREDHGPRRSSAQARGMRPPGGRRRWDGPARGIGVDMP